jgi:hypothetical protein
MGQQRGDTLSYDGEPLTLPQDRINGNPAPSGGGIFGGLMFPIVIAIGVLVALCYTRPSFVVKDGELDVTTCLLIAGGGGVAVFIVKMFLF